MDFNQWWKNEGQFLPPLDRLTTGPVLDTYKAIAAQVWETRDTEIKDLEGTIVGLERELDIAQRSLWANPPKFIS